MKQHLNYLHLPRYFGFLKAYCVIHTELNVDVIPIKRRIWFRHLPYMLMSNMAVPDFISIQNACNIFTHTVITRSGAHMISKTGIQISNYNRGMADARVAVWGQAMGSPPSNECLALNKRNFWRSLLTDTRVMILTLWLQSNLNLYFKLFVSDQNKENEMYRACSTHGSDEKFIHNFSLKTLRERTLGKPVHRWGGEGNSPLK
jgi:hypothetical protein